MSNKMRESEENPWAVVNSAVAFINENSGASGARCLARVLLHCYDNEQPFSVSDMCVLDSQRLSLAWKILALRVAGIRPHERCHNMRLFNLVVDNYWITTPVQNELRFENEAG